MPAQNSLTSFESVNPFKFEGRALRHQVDDAGLPWFNANDVCEALELGNARQALESHVDAEDVQKMDTLSAGGVQAANYINESGLYALIFGSKKPRAKAFKRWVTSEVLPTIRKTGSYGSPRLPGRTTLKAIMGDFKVSTVEIAQAVGVPQETVLNGVRCLQFSGAISGEGAVEHRRTHPQNGLTYREFLLSPTEVLSLAAVVGPGARSKLINLLLSLELDVDAAIQQADVQRLSYEPKPALPDARELEQAALRTLELSYEVCSRLHTKEKARAIAVKDTKRFHGLDLSHLLTQATPT